MTLCSPVRRTMSATSHDNSDVLAFFVLDWELLSCGRAHRRMQGQLAQYRLLDIAQLPTARDLHCVFAFVRKPHTKLCTVGAPLGAPPTRALSAESEAVLERRSRLPLLPRLVISCATVSAAAPSWVWTPCFSCVGILLPFRSFTVHPPVLVNCI